MWRSLLLASLLLLASPVGAEQRHQATGLVMNVDRATRTVVVSHDAIAGFMAAMVMPFRVRDARELDGIRPAMMIGFTLVVTDTASYVVDIRERPYDSTERDPDQNRRLQALDTAMKGRSAPPVVQRGQIVPDFRLLDERSRPVALSDFRGKVVVISFIYTRCPLPDYCLRLTNNFGRLQKRFADRMGRDLILLSITFDPERDGPEVMAKYADIWRTGTEGWRFLTGGLDTVKQVCRMFGMNFWPDEGLLTHSLRTVVIDSERRLAANLEGNQFTAQQLGDLIASTLSRTAENPLAR